MKSPGPLPPTYFFIFVLIVIPLHFLLPLIKILHLPLNLLGIAFIIFGTWIMAWADRIFKQVSTTVKPFEKPSRMIINGPFRISRNPMYLGMAAILLGEGMLLGSLITLIGPLGFVICMEIVFIPGEENNMRDVFGDEFLRYKKQVRRWI